LEELPVREQRVTTRIVVMGLQIGLKKSGIEIRSRIATAVEPTNEPILKAACKCTFKVNANGFLFRKNLEWSGWYIPLIPIPKGK